MAIKEFNFKKIENIWFVFAVLSYFAAIGFIFAYFIGGYLPYIVIAVMWVCIGSLDVILGIHRKRKEEQ